MRSQLGSWFGGMIVWVACVGSASAFADERPTFERDLKPIFSKRCTICHNTKKVESAEISGGLALDTYEGVLKGTGQQAIVLARQPDASSLFTRLTNPDEEIRMPRDDDPLNAKERELVKRWIADGMPRGVVSAETKTTETRKRLARSLEVAVPFETPPAKPNGRPMNGSIRLKAGPMPAVTSVVFRPDGQRLAVGSYGRIVIWDIPKGKPTAFIDDFPGNVSAMVYFNESKRLAVAGGLPGRSGLVRIYEAETAKLIREISGHEDVVTSLAIRGDGTQLATASYDQTVKFWSLSKADEPPLVFKGHSDFVYEVVYLPDGKSVLTASKDRSVKRVDATNAKELRTYSDHNEEVLALAVRADGKEFASSGQEPAIRIWAIDGEKPIKRTGGHGGAVHQLSVSKKSGLMISASADGSARLFKVADWSFDRSLSGLNEWQYAASIDDAGKLAASGGWDGLTRVWDLSPKKPVLLLTLLQPTLSPAEHDWLSVGPEGKVEASENLKPLIQRSEAAKPVTTSPKNGAAK